MLTRHLHRQEVLGVLAEQIRFARRRFGHYDLIDFVGVLFGYALSGGRTLAASYEQLWPFAHVFMTLIGHDRPRPSAWEELLIS